MDRKESSDRIWQHMVDLSCFLHIYGVSLRCMMMAFYVDIDKDGFERSMLVTRSDCLKKLTLQLENLLPLIQHCNWYHLFSSGLCIILKTVNF